jgi:hypothetical protein
VDASAGSLPSEVPASDAGAVSSVDAANPASPSTDASDAEDASDTSRDSGTDSGSANETSTEDLGCGVTLAQEGAWVDLVESDARPAPRGVGGTVRPGTYVLTSAVDYSSNTGTQQLRETLVLVGSSTDGTYTTVRERRSSTGDLTDIPVHGRVGTWSAGPAESFHLTPTCPQDYIELTSYTATSTTLTLFDSFKPTRTYTRVH